MGRRHGGNGAGRSPSMRRRIFRTAPSAPQPRPSVTCEMITALVDQGDVDEANSSVLDCVGKAITAAARRGLDLTGRMSVVGG